MNTGIPIFDDGVAGKILHTGTFSTAVQPGWTLKGLDDPEMIIHNPSDVVVCVADFGRRHELAICIEDQSSLLTRQFKYARHDDCNWYRYPSPESYALQIPPHPGRVLKKLETAIFPVVAIDLESLAQVTDSHLTSIGAVLGDLHTGEVFSWFQTSVPKEGQSHRKIDFATVKWWSRQYQELPILKDLEKLVTEPVPETTIEALVQLTAWFDNFGEYKRQLEVFCNGPEFDATNLSSLYQHFGADVPWQYRRNESVRTMVLMGRKLLNIDPKYKERPGLVEHFAVHDALREFQYCSEIYQCLHAKCQPLIVLEAETLPKE